MIPKLLISIGISIGLLGLLVHFTLSSAEPALWSSLVTILIAYPPVYAFLYFVISLIKTLFQSWRFRILIRASEPVVPSLFHIYLVTLSRNMFVDMLPARLGELSYIAMLNRGCKVSGESCVSSLAISFIFDLIALGFLLAVLLGMQLLGGDFQGWMAGVLIMLALLIVFLLLLLYPAIALFNRAVDLTGWFTQGILNKGRNLLKRIEQALEDTRKAGISGRLLALSVGVRATKYIGFYLLFIGVVSLQFPEMSRSLARVLPALVSAEAGASLPVPAFMGFGTYEAAGTLALTALGAAASTSLIVMLAMHVVSQIIDYLLGGIGLVLFIFKTGKAAEAGAVGRRWKILIPAVMLAGTAALFLVYEMRAVKKRGSLQAPDRGQAVVRLQPSDRKVVDKLDGFLVWSSNRSGNHDIYLRSFPDGTVTQLTSHPHTEYYPRISPDGRRVVFARSHEPWVSQRNVYAWDVWLLDLKSGKERLLAKNGNVPTWSADGKAVYFQRNANQVVEITIKSGKERVMYQSGVNVDVPPKTELQTPNLSSDGRLAVTFRQTMRATAVAVPDGKVRKTGNGCQLIWAPNDEYLVKVDKGGRGGNTIYKLDPKTLNEKKWFDAPDPYSHEYFPKIANSGDILVYGASSEGHEHDSADYEIFLWTIGTPESKAVRLTHHTGNDCWPDIYLRKPFK